MSYVSIKSQLKPEVFNLVRRGRCLAAVSRSHRLRKTRCLQGAWPFQVHRSSEWKGWTGSGTQIETALFCALALKVVDANSCPLSMLVDFAGCSPKISVATPEKLDRQLEISSKV